MCATELHLFGANGAFMFPSFVHSMLACLPRPHECLPHNLIWNGVDFDGFGGIIRYALCACCVLCQCILSGPVPVRVATMYLSVTPNLCELIFLVLQFCLRPVSAADGAYGCPPLQDKSAPAFSN